MNPTASHYSTFFLTNLNPDPTLPVSSTSKGVANPPAPLSLARLRYRKWYRKWYRVLSSRKLNVLAALLAALEGAVQRLKH